MVAQATKVTVNFMESPFERQEHRRVMVTGTGGLGLEAAKTLAELGATIIIAGRDQAKGEATLNEIVSHAPSAHADFELVDLASLASIRAMVQRQLDDGEPLDVLINNAGIMSPPQRRLTVDGFEAQFGTNHLGHFALTLGLLPLLRKSAAARVVHVTSIAHRYGQLDFADLQNERHYKAGVAYCQSKLAVALFARELQRRAEASEWSLQSMAAHPGFATTNLFAAEQGARSFATLFSTKVIAPLLGHSAQQGSQPIVFAAASPAASGGKLYGPTGFMEMKGPPGECAFARTAQDHEASARLWTESERLIGMSL